MSEEVPGFKICVHRSLTEPILFAGVPRVFAILNWSFCAALVLGYKSWYVIPVSIILHIVAVILTKKDPYFFEILKSHIKDKNIYMN